MWGGCDTPPTHLRPWRGKGAPGLSPSSERAASGVCVAVWEREGAFGGGGRDTDTHPPAQAGAGAGGSEGRLSRGPPPARGWSGAAVVPASERERGGSTPRPPPPGAAVRPVWRRSAAGRP